MKRKCFIIKGCRVSFKDRFLMAELQLFFEEYQVVRDFEAKSRK